MGIYPHTEIKDRRPVANGETWTEVRTQPGLTQTRVVIAAPWVEKRTDCYCCSCDDEGLADPYCRNHGWVGERPCDTHGMPGEADDFGVMPVSVQRRLAGEKP
jgi:hypothetical protein